MAISKLSPWLKGKLYRKNKHPSTRMEAACDDSHCIWYVMFRTKEKRNFRTIHDNSTLFNDMLNGTWSAAKPNVLIGNHELKRFYYLVI